MRRLLPFLLLLLCSHAFAQEHHRLAGYVQMPGEPLVSYYLEITVNGTSVTGHSITDYTGGNRLKASIAGRLSPASELYIEETGSLDDPKSGVQEYCYFSAHLKLTVANGKQRWSGPFESKGADGKPCRNLPSSGFMTVLDNAPALDMPKPRSPEPKPVPGPPAGMRVQEDRPKSIPPPQKPQPPKASPPPKDTVKPQPKKISPPPKDTTRPQPKKEIPKPFIVIPRPKAVVPPPPKDTNNCIRSYEWGNDTLSFDIFDGWTIDGDIVSLSVGGRTLLDHAKLSGNRQHFTLPLAPGLNVITIALHEDGIDPPNTPNMTLYDGIKKYDLNISGNPGETARICIFRKR